MSRQEKLAKIESLEEEAKNYLDSFGVCATYGVDCSELLGFAKDCKERAKKIREKLETQKRRAKK